MEFLTNLFNYGVNNWDHLLTLTWQHILMVAIGIGLALLVGVPLGVISARKPRIGSVILSVANMVQVFPSIALLGILMVFFGLGAQTIIIGLFLYSLLPIIRNTYVGLKEVDSSVSEAGVGVGMTTFQLLFKVQLPLALPFLIAGLRVATVIAISVATIAPYIGGDGLGRDILSGINSSQPVKIYSGALLAALLAIIADYILGKTQEKLEQRV